MSTLMLYFLGPPRIECHGQIIQVDTRKAIALLAYLAITGELHRRDELATLLWPEYNQKRGRAALRRTLSSLRRAIGNEWLEANRQTISLNNAYQSAIWLDVAQFLQRTAGNPVSGDNKLTAYLKAINLYRDDFLTGFSLRDSPNFDDWQFEQARQLRHHLSTILDDVVQIYSHQHKPQKAIQYGQRLLRLDPLREATHRQLMYLHVQAGERAAALHQYQSCTHILDEELGVEPDEETTELYLRIRDRKHKTMVAKTVTPTPISRSGLVALDKPRHNLPTQTMPFIGREDELALIAERLADPYCRLLTLVGLGGIGKTRLALETAVHHLDHYDQGVCFVPLAAVSRPNLLPATIAESLDFTLQGHCSPRQQLLTYLQHKHILLILDNFEHLLDGTDLITEMLSVTSHLKLLVTSRQRLNLQEEWLCSIHGLSYPQSETETAVGDYRAIQFFTQSAQRVQAAFTLTPTEAPYVTRICQLVEGMPLGLELAAAWVRGLSCREITAEIEHNHNFLATTLQNIPARHRSLYTVFSYSWRLLTPAEQQTLRRIAIFHGGFSKEAAIQVALTSPIHLLNLVDKSLLQLTPSGRYDMHEALRQFAITKLEYHPTEQADVRQRHCAYYATFSQQRASHLKSQRQKEALMEMSVEIENIRIGWQWALKHQNINHLRQYIDSLAHFYELYAWFQEGYKLFDDAIQTLQAHYQQTEETKQSFCQLMSKLLGRQAMLAFHLSHHKKAKQLVQEALDLLQTLDEQTETIFSLNTMGKLAFTMGEYPQARTLHKTCLAFYQESGDLAGIASSVNNLGDVAWKLGDYAQAKQLYEQSLSIRRQLGHQSGTAVSLNSLGAIAYAMGQYPEAKAFFIESLQINEAMKNRAGVTRATMNLGVIYRILGDHTEAKRHYLQSLTLSREIGHQQYEAGILNNLGELARRHENYKEAWQFHLDSLAIYETTKVQHGVALAHNNLGIVSMGLGNYQEAQHHFCIALKLTLDFNDTPRTLDVLTEIPTLLCHQGHIEEGLLLSAFTLHYPIGDKAQKERAEQIFSELTEQMSHDTVTALHAKGKALHLEEAVQLTQTR